MSFGLINFIVYIKTGDIYSYIAKDIDTRFDTSNYELHRPLFKGKNKNVIRLMKDELRGKIMTECRIDTKNIQSFNR